jgi:hypothetical protein
MSTVLAKKIRLSDKVARVLALGALGALFYACTPAEDSSTDSPPTNPARTGGSSGTSSTGGNSGTSTGGTSGSNTGGSSGSSTGGSVGTGGSSDTTGGTTGSNGGTGGSSDTGGSAGTSTGGTSGDGAGGSGPTDAPVATTDTPPASGGKHPIMAGNALVACKSPAKYRLPSAPAADFCAFYEMYCHYDPTGKEMNKGAAPPAGEEPWFYKDYDDCIARYMAAKPASQSCRAGQLCGTNFKAGQGCTHSTGHFDTCP